MYPVFCIMFPSILGLKISDTLSKKESIKDNIINYLLYVFISNALCFGILKIMGKVTHPNNMMNLFEDATWALRYLVIITVINIILGIVMAIIESNIDITILRKNEKKEK